MTRCLYFSFTKLFDFGYTRFYQNRAVFNEIYVFLNNIRLNFHQFKQNSDNKVETLRSFLALKPI
jgi:hypothetical protein